MCKEWLIKLRKKLKNDPDILSQYNEIFEGQRRLGIIETVSEPGKKRRNTLFSTPSRGSCRNSRG